MIGYVKITKSCQSGFNTFYFIVDSALEWLEHRNCNRHGLGLKSTRAIQLCPWERHFITLSPAWRSRQALLTFSHICKNLKNQNKNFKWTAISWHLRKQVGVIACSMY